MIPVLIVAGIAMWLVWKGYRAFQQYENRKEARAPKATRDQLRREGEQLSSSDDNDDNGGGGSQQRGDQKKKKRIRFHDDDLHSDAWLTRQEIKDREEFLQHLKELRRLRHRSNQETTRSHNPQHLHLSDSHNITTTEVHVHRPVQKEVHQHLHLQPPPTFTTGDHTIPQTVRTTMTTTKNTGTISRRSPAQETLHQPAAELLNPQTLSPSHAFLTERLNDRQ